jgi:cytochrome P450
MAAPLELSPRPAEFWDPHRPAFVDPTGILNVFSYEHVQRVLADPVFSSYGIDELDYRRIHPASGGLWMADGQRHHDMRTVGAGPFREPQLSQWAPGIRGIAEDLLAAIAGDGNRIDIVADYARPLHLGVICLLLGIPATHAERLDAWVRRSAEPTAVSAVPPEPDEVRFLAELLDQRRRRPEQGLVDALLAHQAEGYLVDGRRLSDEDLIGHLAMLIHAGWEAPAATANLIVFAEDAGVLDQLPGDQRLLASTLEETLRWYSPFPCAQRQARAAAELGGLRVDAGQWVYGWLTAANRDPSRFADPDRFDPGRFDGRRLPHHLSFGRGPRLCLGAPLARLELQIGAQVLLARLPGLRRDRTTALRWTLGINDALTALECTYQARQEPLDTEPGVG